MANILVILIPIVIIGSVQPMKQATVFLVLVIVLVRHPLMLPPNFSLMMVGCVTLTEALVANILVTKDLWITDSGASCHMTYLDVGMFDYHPVDEQIKIGDGTFTMVVKIVSKNGLVKQPVGTMAKVTISNIKYVPGL
jgi:hypothetical protein